MKKLYLVIALLCCQLFWAQVGINTTVPNAQLDIRSTNQASPTNTDGMLIPRIDIFPAVNPTAAQQGMMVYLTTTTTFSGNPKPFGFYYWDISTLDWIAMGSNNPNSWNTAGNSGTNPAANFIGTTDNKDLFFKMNNFPSGRISPQNTSFGYQAMMNPLNLGNSAFGNGALSNIRFGSDNIAIGSLSQMLNQDGDRNISIGNEALNINNSNDNIAIGYRAASLNTLGEFNIAIGTLALQFCNNNSNTAIGYQSQFNNSTGADNVAVGKNALGSNSNGNENTAIGNNALSGGNYSEHCTAVGFRALASNHTFDNTAVGYESMFTNGFGRFNTALGMHSLTGNTDGDNNTAIGINSLNTNTTGDNNTAIGAEATTSQNNLTNATAIGANAMVGDSNALVLGSVAGFNGSFNNVNVGIGTIIPTERLHVVGNIRMVDGNQASGKILTSDTNGVASWSDASTIAWGTNGNASTDPNVNYIGTSDNTDVTFRRANIRSGFLGSTSTSFGFNTFVGGSNNSVFGAQAFSGGGTDNAAFGYQAMGSSTNASGNAAFGSSALFSNINGSGNVAIGSSALHQNNFGFDNTAVGFFSSRNNTTGSGNTALGMNSLGGITTGTNNTALGIETNFDSATTTNSTAIGANAQVDTSNAIVLGSVNGINGATNTVNVGIGTNFPLDRLHVVGNIRMVDGNQAAGKILTSDSNGTASWANAPSSGWTLTGNSGIGSGNFIGTTNDADLIFKRFSTEGGRITTLVKGNTFFGLQSGSVATGTNNTYLGTLAGSANTTGQQNVMVGRQAGGTGTSGSDNVLIGNGAGISNASNQNVLIGSFAGNGNTTGGNNTAVGYSAGGSAAGSSNNTSIGAFSGTSNTGGIRNTLLGSNTNVGSSSLTNAGAIGADATVSTSNSLVLGSVNGVNSATATVNVGIGTTSPLDRLHVAGSIRMVDGTQGNGKVLTSNANGTGSWQTLSTNYWGLNGNASTNDPATPTTYGTSTIGATENWSGTTDANDYVLGTNNIERLRIKQTTGFVGIGTAAPSRKLHVFTGSSGGTPNGNADFVLESNGAIYQHFLAPAANETGLLFGSNVSSIRGGVLYNNNTDILQFRAGGNTNRMIITSAGDVGIGTAAPGGQFELSLDEGRKPGTTVWTLTSDARLKNVEGDFTLGLNEIKQLKPIRYHYKNVGQRVFESQVLQTEFSGFLAQDVQKVFPNCVTTDADGYLSLNMHEILIASINALKELDAKNNQLQAENEALKAKLQQHDEQIARILAELEKRK